MNRKDEIQESFLCLIAGVLLAIWIIALMLDGGNRGLLDLF